MMLYTDNVSTQTNTNDDKYRDILPSFLLCPAELEDKGAVKSWSGKGSSQCVTVIAYNT